MSKDQNTIVMEARITILLIVNAILGLFLFGAWWFS